MIDEGHYLLKDIQVKVKSLRSNFNRLAELVGIRGERLKDAVQSLQVYTRKNALCMKVRSVENTEC